MVYTTAFLNDAKGNLYSLLFVDMKIDGYYHNYDIDLSEFKWTVAGGSCLCISPALSSADFSYAEAI